ncbi:MAG: primosomal protein N' [Bacteroidales bacterium]|nr:primosomal protein N' [Bacteroidales bacterium]
MSNSLFADIIIPVALKNSYTYQVDERLKDLIKVGSRVYVQFGIKGEYIGVVEKLHNNKPDYKGIKSVTRMPQFVSEISLKQLDLWRWISRYYMCTIGEVMDAALPSGLKAGLMDENRADSRPGYKPKEEVVISLAGGYDEDRLNKILDSMGRSPARARLLTAFLDLTGCGDEKFAQTVRKGELLKTANVSGVVLSALVEKKIFQKSVVEALRFEQTEKICSSVNSLSPAQAKAKDEINSLFIGKETVLLKGVTSSGKTEIYIHLIEEQLKKSKQVLYLLPEIALTTQIINRLKIHFGDEIGVYHSKFNNSERIEVWRRISGDMKDHRFNIILGVRSSLFLPFCDLGLVIVDEEHDNSYKQQDPAPRYNARDTAMILARKHGAKVLLGSATPSIETMYNAHNGKYGLVEISERYGKVNMPEMVIADTRDAYRRKIMVSHFTPVLINAIEEAIAGGNQIVLFRNRRGYAPVIQCRECGWTPVCRQCAVNMTYHKGLNKLRCHYCGAVQTVPKTCGSCNSTVLEMKGFGTEKIEDEIQMLFPEVKVARMDLDSTRKKGSVDKILSDLEKGKTDILIGTQMVSKGLDFEGLTVVGILNVDNMLLFPDFRSHEKCFQLIEQVSGRAGRRSKRGKVIIQTSDPNHSVMRQAINHHYDAMFREQIDERKEFNYPPFIRLIKIYIKHKEMDNVKRISVKLAALLRNSFDSGVLGPEYPLVARVQSLYLMTILLKIEPRKSLVKTKETVLWAMEKIKRDPGNSSVRIYADVDPL